MTEKLPRKCAYGEKKSLFLEGETCFRTWKEANEKKTLCILTIYFTETVLIIRKMENSDFGVKMGSLLISHCHYQSKICMNYVIINRPLQYFQNYCIKNNKFSKGNVLLIFTCLCVEMFPPPTPHCPPKFYWYYRF